MNASQMVKKYLDDNLQSGAIDKEGQGTEPGSVEAQMLQATRKRDNASRRSKESRKSAGRHLSRHLPANSDLLDLGLQVGERDAVHRRAEAAARDVHAPRAAAQRASSLAPLVCMGYVARSLAVGTNSPRSDSFASRPSRHASSSTVLMRVS